MPALLRRSVLLGLATAYSSLRASVAFARADTEQRFVVVILRGAMDGLSAVAPYGDRDLMALREPLVAPRPGQDGGLLDLGGFYGLHPALTNLHRLYAAGELAIIHAVAGPYRDRSHFAAQDMLEAGADHRMTSGWLNRAVAALPAGAALAQHKPMAVGASVSVLLQGAAPVENWAPSGRATPLPQLFATIAAINQADPLTGPAIRLGLEARGFSKEVLDGANGEPARMEFPSLARSAGKLLAAPNGPRIAALDLGGWDTHASQVFRMQTPLQRLDEGIGAFRDSLGPAWSRTAILVMTEFGRTARINGTQGTDHGTGTVAFVAGGAVQGGRVIADWPSLRAGSLYEERDLMPTTDLRAVAKTLVTTHLGVPASALATVFPGSAQVAPLAGLLRG
jgi:uncharacterized protein (DUF1501 family)